MAPSDSGKLSSRYADGNGFAIDPQRIPDDLRHLLPFALRWAIGDDAERAEYMAATPEQELREFVDAVWPLLPRIQEWCDGHLGEAPVPDEVVLYLTMAEAAAEADACHIGFEEAFAEVPEVLDDYRDITAPPSGPGFSPAAWIILALILLTLVGITAMFIERLGP